MSQYSANMHSAKMGTSTHHDYTSGYTQTYCIVAKCPQKTFNKVFSHLF